MCVANPERVAGIVTQNGNAYAEDFGAGVEPLTNWWWTLDQALMDQPGHRAAAEGHFALSEEVDTIAAPVDALLRRAFG